jgi:NAD-dependent SIR2 family protein deacetylase
MYHCDRCGWDGETPELREWRGKGCGGVWWTLPVCPECGEEVSQTVVPQNLPRAGQSSTEISQLSDR